MANEDWEWAGEYWEMTGETPDLEAVLFNRDTADPVAQELMWEAINSDADDNFAALRDYLRDEYGIDFDEEWDWEDFREWYDAQ